MSDENNKREQLCYQQNFEQARSLNEQMNRVPVLAVTVTGGLWFGAGVVDGVDEMIRFLLVLLAGFSNLALIFALTRIRDVFQSYMEKVQAFYPDAYASGKPQEPKAPFLQGYSMITMYRLVMSIAALFSFGAAFMNYWPFDFEKCWGIAALLVFFLVILVFMRKKIA
tara:strand:- start:2984 stop:3487 length:504 start_codon:yes stop_codon:yes gene_type:complete